MCQRRCIEPHASGTLRSPYQFPDMTLGRMLNVGFSASKGIFDLASVQVQQRVRSFLLSCELTITSIG